MRAEQIIEDLWADAAGTGRNTLQSKVSQLRRALGDPGLVTAAGGGYTLARRPGAAWTRWRSRAWPSRSPPLAGRATRRLPSTRPTEALALFRGDVLVDAGDGEWLAAAPGPPGGGAARPGRGPARGAGRAGSGRRRDRRARGPGRAAPAARGPVVLADHRALPHRPAGRRAGGVRPGARAAARRARRRPRARPAQPRGADPAAEPGAGRRAGAARGRRPARQPAGADLGPGRPRGRAGRPCTGLVGEHRLVTVVGRPASARRGRRSRWPAGSSRRAASGWSGSTAVDPTTSIPRVVAETLHVSGGEAMLVDRFAGAEAVLLLDNCEHVVDAGRRTLVARLLDARARTARARHQPGAARPGRRGGARARAAGAGRLDGPVRGPGDRSTGTSSSVDEDDRGRRRGGVPRPGRAAAGDRAGRRPGEVAVGAGDRPPARRPVQPAARPHQPGPGAAARPGRRHRLELRPALPRRPARAVGAVGASPAARRWPRPSTCSARWTCPPSRPSTSWAGWSTGRWSASTWRPAARSATGCSTASAPSPGTGWPRPGSTTSRPPRTPPGSPEAADRCAAEVRGPGQPDCLAFVAGRAGQHRRRAGLVRRARPAARPPPRHRLRLDLGGARRRRWRVPRGSATPSTAAGAAGAGRGAGRGAAAGRLARGLGRRRRAGAAATSTGSPSWSRTARRRAGARPTRAGTWRSCGSSRAARRTCSPRRRRACEVYRDRGFTWEIGRQPAAGGVRLDHARRHGRRDPRRPRRPSSCCRPIGDSWGLVHAAGRCSARSPRPSTGSTTRPPL